MGVVRQLVEKLCVVITIILVYENALVFYQHLFPYWWSQQFYGQFFFHFIVGHWLLINTIRHYYLGIAISPGFVTDLKKELPIDQLSYTKCSKCDLMRPPRAHHCKVCQKCVLRYDHHCPWINNCVGYGNHVHFLLFCIYMAIISAYSTIVGRREFQRAVFHGEVPFGLFDPLRRPEQIAMATLEHHTIGPVTGVLTLFLFVINLAAMGLILSLTIWQMCLITKGQTCVEEKIGKSLVSNSKQKQQHPRSYNLGRKQNWMTFFEVDSTTELIVRLLIPYSFTPKHDGTQWPLNHDE